jgi:hypothetical protein
MYCTGEPLDGLFLTNMSHSYKEVGSYNLSGYSNFGSVPSAQYGLDTVVLNFSGPDGSSTMALPHQAIGSSANVKIDLGFLGLTPRLANLSTDIGILQSQTRKSFLQSLEDTRQLQGKTWGYQAGAFNRTLLLPNCWRKTNN